MTGTFTYKIYFALGVVLCLRSTSSADVDTQDRSKYKYGYVISHQGGSTQAHLESRNGNLALGRYYVNLQNGTGQKVTYFADDLGFHTGVSYSSQDGRGSSKTQIAMGQKALAALGDSEVQQNSAVTVASPTLLFGNKFLKAALDSVAPTPTAHPKLNYTPVPGGFYLTRDYVESANETTEHPKYIAGLTSQTFSSGVDEHSQIDPAQTKTNSQTFYAGSENANNKIKELHIQFTTPPNEGYDSNPQQGPSLSGTQHERTQFSPRGQTVKVSTFATNFNDLYYSKEKSIEKSNFADIDAQIISEVQKHAEQIIMKDLKKSQNVNVEGDFARFSSGVYQPSTVTMQPIVVTNAGEAGLNEFASTTPVPEVSKSSKNLHSGTINSVKISEKNSDQALEDSGYFRISLSPSLASSINVSQTPHQSINSETADRNSVSNNSTLCEIDLCENDNQQTFSTDLTAAQPQKDTKEASSAVGDISDSSGTSKVVHTFYPENKLHDEKHYVTTIDVQKAISLDINQNEAGSIQLAQNFPFNKIKPFDQNPTVQPLTSNQISIAPGFYSAESTSNVVRRPQEPYILNTVSTAPGLFDVTPNQNGGVFQGLGEAQFGQIQYNPPVQDRAGNNRLGYEGQLVVPPAPVVLTNEAAEEYRQKQEDLQQVEKNIQELRQQILSNIDAQHEEEQRKQNLVDEERKQYFENLKKVEALKNQNSYNAAVHSQADVIQATVSPVPSAGNVNNVEIVPQAQFVSAPEPQTQYQPTAQIQYDPAPQTQYELPSQQPYVPPAQTFQTEIKDFTHEVVVPQPAIQQIPNLEVYQKQVLSYSQDSQTANRQFNLYDSQNLFTIDNNIQQSAPAYTAEKIQLANYVPQIAPVSIQSNLAIPQTAQQLQKPKNIAVFNGPLNTVPVNLGAGVAPSGKVTEGKAVLVNPIVPFDYTKLLQVKQPVSLLQTYQVPLASETKIRLPEVYPQQVTLPLQIPQTYKFLSYPDVAPVPTKQYYSTLTQKPTNKLRVQPLKPSTPDEDSQREAVQNLLSQPQFHQTYYYPGLPVSNRLQLRHIRKNQNSNSDQVHSQSIIRRGKSLKNLRIEYGFKPPLRPSVEFSEEVKPSIYGPSIKPQ